MENEKMRKKNDVRKAAVSLFMALVMVLNITMNVKAYSGVSYSETCKIGYTVLAAKVKGDATDHITVVVSQFTPQATVYAPLFAVQIIPSSTGEVLRTTEISSATTVTWGLDDPDQAIGLTFTLRAHNTSANGLIIKVAGTLYV